MKHHVKVRAVYDPCTDKITVHVLEQTHVGREFGPDPVKVNSSRIVHNGLKLGSARLPEWYPGNNYYYVRGVNPEGDNNGVELTISEWERVKKAIIMYNEWGETQ